MELMKAFQQGRPSSFDSLYELIRTPAYHRAKRMGLGHDDAEEIAQKVLVRVYLYAGKAHFSSRQHIWAWIYTITAREVYKAWRKKRPEVVPNSADDLLFTSLPARDPAPSEEAIGEELSQALSDCIGELSDTGRLYLLGPLQENLTFRQAAQLHGLTLGQFKHRYEKALRKVKDCLKAKGHDV